MTESSQYPRQFVAKYLACPVCHGPLSNTECPGCRRSYPSEGGIIDFTPRPVPDERVRHRWQLWAQLEANGARAYEFDPPSSLSVGERNDARAFAEFCRFEGLVLDVGCGPQEMPSYAEGLLENFVGIDPLRGFQPRRFSFVQGIAEYLPFRDGVFGQVLYATSIDHLLAPDLALREAHRVARPGGSICVWLGELPSPPFRERLRRRKTEPVTEVATPQRRMSFDVPSGAADAFHVAHPRAREVQRWLKHAGLSVVEVTRPIANSCFIRAVVPSHDE
jgi:SAM-dependent methyltransferase